MQKISWLGMCPMAALREATVTAGTHALPADTAAAALPAADSAAGEGGGALAAAAVPTAVAVAEPEEEEAPCDCTFCSAGDTQSCPMRFLREARA